MRTCTHVLKSCISYCFTLLVQVGIVGENHTKVEVSIPSLGVQAAIMYNDSTWTEGQSIFISLEPFQTVQLLSNHDITGLKITVSPRYNFTLVVTLRVHIYSPNEYCSITAWFWSCHSASREHL